MTKQTTRFSVQLLKANLKTHKENIKKAERYLNRGDKEAKVYFKRRLKNSIAMHDDIERAIKLLTRKKNRNERNKKA